MENKVSKNTQSWTKINLSKNVHTINPNHKKIRKKKPDWLRVKLPSGKDFTNLRKIVDSHSLHTICESGNCPNMGECWVQELQHS